MVLSSGLNWKIPFIHAVKAQDKSFAIDKSEELNSLTINRTRSFTKSYEITKVKSVFYTLLESNFNQLHYGTVSAALSAAVYNPIDAYLHLLQLF